MSSNWRVRREVPSLPDDEVHIWAASLDRSPTTVARLASLLTPEEMERAGRFYLEQERNRFVVARGLLRTLLGTYLKVLPPLLPILTNEDGKPFLDSSGSDHLMFNLSHSDGLALFAFSRRFVVGVDVERVRSDISHEQLAARFFSPLERAQLECLNGQAKIDTFFQFWTCKEAYIKGRGTGIRLGLSSFDVALLPDGAAQLVATRGEPEEAARWQLHPLHPQPGFAAALAVQGAHWKLHCWSWPAAVSAGSGVSPDGRLDDERYSSG